MYSNSTGVEEVIAATKFIESIGKTVPGERGTEDFFMESIYMPPESKNAVSDEHRRFEEVVAVDIYKDARRNVYMGPSLCTMR